MSEAFQPIAPASEIKFNLSSAQTQAMNIEPVRPHSLPENAIVDALNPLGPSHPKVPCVNNKLGIAPICMMEVARVAGLELLQSDPDQAWMRWVDHVGNKTGVGA